MRRQAGNLFCVRSLVDEAAEEVGVGLVGGRVQDEDDVARDLEVVLERLADEGRDAPGEVDDAVLDRRRAAAREVGPVLVRIGVAEGALGLGRRLPREPAVVQRLVSGRARARVEVELAVLGARERPVVLGPVLVGAAHEDGHRRLVHEAGVVVLEPVVVPAQHQQAHLGRVVDGHLVAVHDAVDEHHLLRRPHLFVAAHDAAQVQPDLVQRADGEDRHLDPGEVGVPELPEVVAGRDG